MVLFIVFYIIKKGVVLTVAILRKIWEKEGVEKMT